MAKGKQRPVDYGVEDGEYSEGTVTYSAPGIVYDIDASMLIRGMDAYFEAENGEYSISELVSHIFIAMRSGEPK